MLLKFKKIEISDWVLLLIVWVLSLWFIVPTYTCPFWDMVIAVSAMIVLYSGYTYVIVMGVLHTFLPQRRFILIIFYIIGFMVICSQLLRLIELPLVFDKPYRFTWVGVMYGLNNMGTECGFLMAIFAGKQFVSAQQKVLLLEKEQTESELRRLQAQVDPHFLFNSLNVLDVLIEQNPTEAREYLKHLSALYRYLLRHKDEEVVPLGEEWTFAQDYIFLLQKRFGVAYSFECHPDTSCFDNTFVFPGALQTLLENAVKHNQGDDKKPILIRLYIKDEFLIVRNTLRPKFQAAIGTGTGLYNLKSRYALMNLPAPRIISTGEEYEVALALIKRV